MSDLPPDPWRVLGIDKSADKGEIRTAYRKLVLKCHPDKIQDEALKAQKQDEFQRVQQAYELLNDDAERSKYEQKVRLQELRKQAAMMAKNMPNSSAPRTSHRQHYADVEIRTAEPSRYKAPQPPTPPSGTPKMSSPPKMSSYSSSHSRSHEEMPNRSYPSEEEERRYARRAASYDTPKFASSKKDDERREREREKEERRRRKQEEEDREFERRERERERERARDEKERVARKERKAQEKAQYERDQKQRDKDRKAKSDEKAHRTKQQEIYVELQPFEEEVVYVPKAEKRSSSRKQPEPPREKSSSRRSEKERTESPKRDAAPIPDQMHQYRVHAINYIERSRGQAVPPTYTRSQSSQDPAAFARQMPPMAVPTPPPAEDFEEESVQRSARLAAAARRPSHDAPKSKDKAKKSAREYDVVDVAPGKPPLTKSMTTPPIVPDTPSSGSPRVSRPHATTQDSYVRTIPMPSLSRGQTWTVGDDMDRTRRGTAGYGAEAYDDVLPPDERRSRRRRNQSPEEIHYFPRTESTRYRVDGTKTSRMDSAPYGYAASSPLSSRYAPEIPEGRPTPSHSSSYYACLKVKEAKNYGYSDVKFAPSYSYDTQDYHTTDYSQPMPA